MSKEALKEWLTALGDYFELGNVGEVGFAIREDVDGKEYGYEARMWPAPVTHKGEVLTQAHVNISIQAIISEFEKVDAVSFHLGTEDRKAFVAIEGNVLGEKLYLQLYVDPPDDAPITGDKSDPMDN